MKYLKVVNLNTDPKGKATIDKINQLIRSDVESKAIKSRFSHINGKFCNIVGSKNIIDSFLSIDEEKFDIKTQIRNVEFLSFNDYEIKLRFNDSEPSITALGIYEFTDTFLEKYKLDKFKKYCIDNKMTELIENDITKCMRNDPSTSYQFRIISDDKQSYLRALTTERYKNYDNHIALFILLNVLHKYSEENNVRIITKEGYISDSSLDINFIFDKKIDLGDGWFMQIGVKAQNNEIGLGSFSVELMYSVFNLENEEDKVNSYTAIHDKIIDVVHTRTIDTIEREFGKLLSIDNFIQSMINNAKKVKTHNQLDSDQIFKLFRTFSDNRTMSSSTRNLLKYEQNNITKNTHKLIEIFDKLSSLVTSIDEKTHLQRLFNEFTESL